MLGPAPRGYVTERDYFEALRAADQRALQIKEEADERALTLQAETQKYKDEKANELRSQIESERGMYATKDDLGILNDKRDTALAALNEKFDLALKPMIEYMAAQTSRSAASLDWRTGLLAVLMIAVVVFVRFV
jgi:hypothetical protein